MIVVQTNRASALFKQAAETLNQSLTAEADYPVFSHWCRFYGENPDEKADSIKLIEPKDYNLLESKANVSKLLTTHGIDNVFPATFTKVEDAIAHPDAVNIWFIKPSHLSGGRGIQILTDKELKDFELPKHNIIQAGVEDIELLDGKKFTARVYALLWDKHVYLFDDGFALVHAPQYQKGSTEYATQVDHRGYQTGKSGVEMKLYSEIDSFARAMPQAKAALKRILPVLENTLKATSSKRYLLLGIDLLPLENGTIKFIEINAIPNFVHSQKVNQQLNVVFFEHVMRVIYGLGSDRLLAV